MTSSVVADVEVRPMTEGDIDESFLVSDAAFTDLDRRLGNQPSIPRTAARYRARALHLLDTDADGCFVSLVAGHVAGVGLALRRGRVWGLSLLVVDPAAQSQGHGRALLDATLGYASDAPVGLIGSSPDARAVRSYSRRGFSFHPTVLAQGVMPPVALPKLSPLVREGGIDDAPLIDDVDSRLRGGSHSPELQVLLEAGNRLFVAERGTRRGYAVAKDGASHILGADDVELAQALLWACLSTAVEGEEFYVGPFRAGQDWALDVMFRAGLSISPRAAGGTFFRGLDPPPLYIPNGAYL